MKVLELFAGTRSIGKVAEERGHEVFSVDYDHIHENIDLYIDINELTSDYVLKHFGKPDLVWASPDCTTYSISAISHHRTKDITTGSLNPKSDYAYYCDKTNKHVLELIGELNPSFYFIENPRGALRKMDFMQPIPRFTVTYCQYGDTRMKPTDIFTNFPDPQFREMCKNGDSCHVSAPRGSKTGTQGLKNKIERSVIPRELCLEVIKMCEKELVK